MNQEFAHSRHPWGRQFRAVLPREVDQGYARAELAALGNMKPSVRGRILAAALRDAWPAWLLIGGGLVAFTPGWLFSTPLSTAVRYAGTTLEIFGLATVAIGLGQMRRLFDRPSLHARIFGWFGRFAAAFKSPKPIFAQASVAGAGTAVGKPRVSSRAPLGTSLEKRVTLLEENLDRLQAELDTKVHEMHGELGTMRQDIQRESEARKAADEDTTRKIREVAVGGLHLEEVGLVWLLFGVLGASLPDEIAGWLRLIAQMIA